MSRSTTVFANWLSTCPVPDRSTIDLDSPGTWAAPALPVGSKCPRSAATTDSGTPSQLPVLPLLSQIWHSGDQDIAVARNTSQSEIISDVSLCSAEELRSHSLTAIPNMDRQIPYDFLYVGANPIGNAYLRAMSGPGQWTSRSSNVRAGNIP